MFGKEYGWTMETVDNSDAVYIEGLQYLLLCRNKKAESEQR